MRKLALSLPALLSLSLLAQDPARTPEPSADLSTPASQDSAPTPEASAHVSTPASQDPAAVEQAPIDVTTRAPQDEGSVAAHDYSKERMRFAFRDYLVPPPPTPTNRAPAITVLDRWGWVFKYIPIFLGETNDGATFGHAVGHSMPDPFWVLETGFAETKSTFKPLPAPRDLTLAERRYRRTMIKVTMDSEQGDAKP